MTTPDIIRAHVPPGIPSGPSCALARVMEDARTDVIKEYFIY
jgi:hypothetical protein